MTINKLLSQEFSLNINYVNNITKLLDEGATIPFIARYRKELTGGLDDQILRSLDDRLKYLTNLLKRRDEVLNLITEQGNLTPEIELSLQGATTITEIDDIYRPFRPKRKTRATVAVAKGLQGLADFILAQANPNIEIESEKYINAELEVNTGAEAIAGAGDIIAETISDNAELRKQMREIMFSQGEIKTKLNDVENNFTYEMYDKYSSRINKTPDHRILAINRGEKEKFLKVNLEMDDEKALELIHDKFIMRNSVFEELLEKISLDSYKRLIFDSIEREIRRELTDKANEQAIKMFDVNVEALLMQPPLKDKRILGLDPAYRTGCKIAVIDENSNILDTTVIFPTPPQSKVEEAEMVIAKLLEKHMVDYIAIGNGTATKESEIFVANLIKKLKRKVSYAVVNEAGASIYSASKLGAEELPHLQVEFRSAVSIARRLQDPLAELIKIDVKHLGVGQYQHDMPQARLTEVLNGVVEDSVNKIGVDINTASPTLLSFISGLNARTAKNIVDHRAKFGAFKNREELKAVKALGDKAFELSAGFLRVTNGDNILDNTSVHPESYTATEKLLKHYNLTHTDIADGKLQLLPSMINKDGQGSVAEVINVGVPTLNDIVEELVKPGRDVRDQMPMPILKSELLDISDLTEGMIVDGVVRNVIDFGVFVDISVHQDGLVHISQISNDYIKHPSEVLRVGDAVKVKVLSVDVEKKRISLTMKNIIVDE